MRTRIFLNFLFILLLFGSPHWLPFFLFAKRYTHQRMICRGVRIVFKSWQLVILDRDGVINYDSDDYIKSPQEWTAIPGSLAAVKRLCTLGLQVAVASNQAGIARGIFQQSDLEAIHQKMLNAVEQAGGQFTTVQYCTDGPNSHSPRRKPNPGMLLEIMDTLAISAKNTLFIGDSYTDFQAAQRAKCAFALVKTGKGQQTLADHPELCQQVPIYADLAECVDDDFT